MWDALAGRRGSKEWSKNRQILESGVFCKILVGPSCQLSSKKYFSSSPVVVLHCRRHFHPPAAKPSRSPAVSNRARSAPPRGESLDPTALGVRPGQSPEIWDPHLQCEPPATVLYSQLEGAVHLLRAQRRRPPFLPRSSPSSPAPTDMRPRLPQLRSSRAVPQFPHRVVRLQEASGEHRSPTTYWRSEGAPSTVGGGWMR
jgi:hypothetical protein